MHYSFEEEELQYICEVIEFLAENGYKFLQFYLFDPQTGEWMHKEETEMKIDWLNFDILLKDKLYASNENARKSLLKEQLRWARNFISQQPSFQLDKLEDLEDIGYFYVA